MSVSLRIHVYQKTRSKELLQTILSLNFSILYQIIHIQNQIVNAICDEIDENNDQFITNTFYFKREKS